LDARPNLHAAAAHQRGSQSASGADGVERRSIGATLKSMFQFTSGGRAGGHPWQVVGAGGDETGGPSAAGLVISPTGKGGFFRNSVASPLLTPIMPSRPLAWPTSVESDEEEDEDDDFHGDGGGVVTNFSRSSLASRLKKSLSTPSFRSFFGVWRPRLFRFRRSPGRLCRYIWWTF